MNIEKKKNKRYIFTYDPSTEYKTPESNYIFANSSGNPINKNKNLKLSNVEYNMDEEEDEEDIELNTKNK